MILLLTIWKTVFLLICSNVFMTFAWYAHLRNLHNKAWYVAALASWGIALFEYLLQVPANRLGYSSLNLAQLKITQEVITLAMFVPFAVFYMHQPVKSNYSHGVGGLGRGCRVARRAQQALWARRGRWQLALGGH